MNGEELMDGDQLRRHIQALLAPVDVLLGIIDADEEEDDEIPYDELPWCEEDEVRPDDVPAWVTAQDAHDDDAYHGPGAAVALVAGAVLVLLPLVLLLCIVLYLLGSAFAVLLWLMASAIN
jgi:hypothetical protein